MNMKKQRNKIKHDRKRLQQEYEEQMETVLASRKSVERKVRQNNETNKPCNRHEHKETKKTDQARQEKAPVGVQGADGDHPGQQEVC